MRSIGIATSALIAAFVLCAVGVEGASAAAVTVNLCMQVSFAGTGIFEDSKCFKEKTKGEYTLVKAGGQLVESESVVAECVRVVVVGSGTYGNSGCSAPGGSDEWTKAMPAKGLSGSAGTTALAVSTGSVTCSHTSIGAPKLTSSDTIGGIVLTSTGCKAKIGTEECEANSVGASAKTIVTHTLKGELGQVSGSEAASGVGLLLEPTTGKEIAKLAKTSCVSETSVAGAVAGEFTPVNTGATAKLQTTGKLSFAVKSGQQKIKSIILQGTTVKPKLTAFGLEATEEEGDELTFEEPMEVD
jgi:hypothetical protein